jgi:hypothetical protein
MYLPVTPRYRKHLGRDSIPTTPPPTGRSQVEGRQNSTPPRQEDTEGIQERQVAQGEICRKAGTYRQSVRHRLQEYSHPWEAIANAHISKVIKV